MPRIDGLTLAIALVVGLSAVDAAAQTQADRPTPPSVTLTLEQWNCLSNRLDNLLASTSDKVRVPLSPCGIGTGTRGPGASNPTASGAPVTRSPPIEQALPQELAAKLTRSPLYLTKGQLDCIRTQLPRLRSGANRIATIDFPACKVAG